MTTNTAGGAGALLSGMAGGYSSGLQMQRNMQQQNNGLGLPGVSSTGAQGLPQTQPALPATPDAKAATTESTGMWGTIAGLLNPQK